MPTISSGISIALQAILAHSQVLEVTEHNVANANTEGYHRQSALLTTAVPSGINGADYAIGAGMRGSGVTVDQIKRFTLDFFDGRYRSVSAETQYWEAQSQILNQLEPMLAETTEDGILPKLDQFWAGWEALSNDPTNTSLRTILLDDASSLASAFNRRATQISQMRRDQNQVISSEVDTINNLAEQVAQLNGEIARVLSVGEQPNDLMDKRDLALDQLAELTGSVSYTQKDGQMLVSIGGHVLVTGHDAFQLETRPSTSDTSVLDVYWGDNQQVTLNSGALKGILDVRTTLEDQLAGLDTLAGNLITQVNTIHTSGFDLNDNPGVDFFSGTDAASIAVNITDAASVVTASAAGQAGNNDIALQMAALKDAKILSGGTETANEFYTSQVSDLGVATKSAADKAYQHGLVSKALGAQRESVGGVNLDEEAANMAKAQKAYQAAARVMTAYDDLLDTIINRMGLVGR